MNSHSKKEMTSSESQNKQDGAPRITFVGLDISKARLDIHHSGKHREERNSPDGHRAFIKHLQSIPHPRVVCEATGGHETAVVATLLNAGIEVCVVMPSRVRRLADAHGWMAKNDRIDARLLAVFGESIKPRLASPADPCCLRLREMLDYRRLTSDQLIETRNRLDLSSGYLREGIEKRIKALKEDMEKVDMEIAAHIAAHPILAAKSKRMTQMKGVGPVLSATILAYLPELGEIEDKEIASLAGVAPHAKDSGNKKGRRRAAGGRVQVRSVLYMAATAASRSNPILREFYRRLKAEKGKPHKVAIVAVMRKMITVLNKLLSDPQFSLA